MKSRTVIGAAASLAVALLGLGATDASAAGASPDSLCSGDLYVNRATNASITFTQASGPNSSVTGGPGVTLGISTSTTFTVGGSITASAEVDASAVVAAVKVSTGVTITTSKSGTTAVSGSWTVPSNWQLGRLAIGSNKYQGTVTRYHERKDCSLARVGSSALYNAPANEWTFNTTRVA